MKHAILNVRTYPNYTYFDNVENDLLKRPNMQKLLVKIIA